MNTFILLAVIVGLYFIFRPSIDIDNKNKQILLWYGSDPTNRKFIKLYSW